MPGGFLGTETEVLPQVAPQPEATADEAYLEEERKAREDMERSKQEQDQHVLEEAKEDSPTTQVAVASNDAAVAPVAQTIAKDEVDVQVAKILEEGVNDYFKDLDPAAQARFKAKGEEVTSQIAVMVRHFKVNVEKVLKLVHDWLLTIPSANKFFIEQEAKIKTDEILQYEEDFHKQQTNRV